MYSICYTRQSPLNSAKLNCSSEVTLKKVEDLGKIAHQFRADVIFNCTGVWASQLTKDKSMAPLRGQVMRVKAPWIKEVIMDDLDDGNYIISK